MAAPGTRSVGVQRLRTRPIVDRELEWFFNRAESDMGLRSNFASTVLVDPDDERSTPEDAAEAAHAYRRIRGWLLALGDADAGVLQVAYEVRPWPRALYDELGRLTGVVVRLACALDPWPPNRDAQVLVEMARAEWLAKGAGSYRAYGVGPLVRLRREGELRFTRAHHGYNNVRGAGPCLVRAS